MTETPFTKNDQLRLEAHRNIEAIRRVIFNLREKRDYEEGRTEFDRRQLTKDIERLREEIRDITFAAPLEPGQVRYIVFGGQPSWHQQKAGHATAWQTLFNFTPAEMEAWGKSYRSKRKEDPIYWRELQRTDV